MPEAPYIERWLVNSFLEGSTIWLKKEPPALYNVLAYGWSDGLVTWKDER